MNFNANTNARQPGTGPIRKAKRVSDVNAIGPTVPSSSNSYMPMPNAPFQAPVSSAAPIQPTQQVYGVPDSGLNQNSAQYGFNQNYGNPSDFNAYGAYPSTGLGVGVGGMPNNMPMPQTQATAPMVGFGGSPIPPQLAQQYAMLQQPIVQDMAIQYGQKLADHGKELVNEKFEKYIPVTRLKYYFAVDNKYVINKLRLIFFPFTHSDWSLKYDQDNPVQPRYDLNAPDLYIPAMAYITYIVLAGFVLGMQNRFSPEKLGMQASSALAYSLFELVVYWITLYIANIPTTLKTLDLLAYSGYKYATMVACILVSILFHKTGYYLTLLYCGLSIAFFLLRTLKAKIVEVAQQTTANVEYDSYGQQSYDHQTVGRKRKLYFLFLVAGAQPVLTLWLSMHLIPTSSS